MDEYTPRTDGGSTGGGPTDGDGAPALEVRDLTKVYDDGTLAVDDVSFTVPAGEFSVLIGPSGCGKTTTLHSIIGKVEPTAGTIRLGGEDVTDRPTHERDIGLVFQDFQLFPHLTVEGNVRYGLDRQGKTGAAVDDRVDEILSLLRLEGERDREPSSLSAGQQQRVALGRSLVLEPELLLLDEPLGDLDYTLQSAMERELLRIHRELDITFAYVTHDQTQAMRLGDRIVVMNDGRIEQSGPVEAVYDRPETAFVATFVGDTNVSFGTFRAGATHTDGDERPTVETDFGTVVVDPDRLPSTPGELDGRELVVAIRPQHLTLDPDRVNGLACTVRDVVHRPGQGSHLYCVPVGRDGTDRPGESGTVDSADGGPRPDDGSAPEERADTDDAGGDDSPDGTPAVDADPADGPGARGARTPETELQLRSYDRLSVDIGEAVTVGWSAADTMVFETVSVTDGVDLQRDILGE